MSRLRHYPFRIHPGWTMGIDFFMECDPDRVPPDDEITWFEVFTQDMLYILYDERYGLDLGWYPEADPKGEFVLQLVMHKDFEPLLKIKTRKFHKIADAIDKITWGISQGILPSSDPTFSLEQITPSLQLQPLKIRHGWKVEKNRFIEMDWETADPQEVRDYLTDDLLLLKHVFDNNTQIHLGWEPAGDPRGQFILKVINPQDEKRRSRPFEKKREPLRIYSTRSVEEVVDWIEKACTGEM